MIKRANITHCPTREESHWTKCRNTACNFWVNTPDLDGYCCRCCATCHRNPLTVAVHSMNCTGFKRKSGEMTANEESVHCHVSGTPQCALADLRGMQPLPYEPKDSVGGSNGTQEIMPFRKGILRRHDMRKQLHGATQRANPEEESDCTQNTSNTSNYDILKTEEEQDPATPPCKCKTDGCPLTSCGIGDEFRGYCCRACKEWPGKHDPSTCTRFVWEGPPEKREAIWCWLTR